MLFNIVNYLAYLTLKHKVAILYIGKCVIMIFTFLTNYYISYFISLILLPWAFSHKKGLSSKTVFSWTLHSTSSKLYTTFLNPPLPFQFFLSRIQSICLLLLKSIYCFKTLFSKDNFYIILQFEIGIDLRKQT